MTLMPWIIIINKNTDICKAHNDKLKAESEAQAVARWARMVVEIFFNLTGEF